MISCSLIVHLNNVRVSFHIGKVMIKAFPYKFFNVQIKFIILNLKVALKEFESKNSCSNLKAIVICTLLNKSVAAPLSRVILALSNPIYLVHI